VALRDIVKVGIIGCGRIANFYLQGLKEAGAQVVAVVDLNQERSKEFAKRAECTRYYHDYKEILKLEEIDAVIVATPNYLHYQHSVDALLAGKHVFCEKPMTTKLQDSIALVKKTKKLLLVFQIGYMKRFNEAFLKAKQLIEELGNIRHRKVKTYLTYSYSSLTSKDPEHWIRQKKLGGGGVLVQSGSHILDIVRFLMGEPIAVTAVFKYLSDVKDIEKYAVLLLEMKKGFAVVAEFILFPYSILAFDKSGFEEEVEVFWDGGRIKVIIPSWQENISPKIQCYMERKKKWEEIRFDGKSQWVEEMKVFVERCRTGKGGPPNAVDGYRVDQIIHDANLSHQKNKKIPIKFKF